MLDGNHWLNRSNGKDLFLVPMVRDVWGVGRSSFCMKEELGSLGESGVKGGASSDFLLPMLLAVFR